MGPYAYATFAGLRLIVNSSPDATWSCHPSAASRLPGITCLVLYAACRGIHGMNLPHLTDFTFVQGPQTNILLVP